MTLLFIYFGDALDVFYNFEVRPDVSNKDHDNKVSCDQYWGPSRPWSPLVIKTDQVVHFAFPKYLFYNT